MFGQKSHFLIPTLPLVTRELQVNVFVDPDSDPEKAKSLDLDPTIN